MNIKANTLFDAGDLLYRAENGIIQTYVITKARLICERNYFQQTDEKTILGIDIEYILEKKGDTASNRISVSEKNLEKFGYFSKPEGIIEHFDKIIKNGRL